MELNDTIKQNIEQIIFFYHLYLSSLISIILINNLKMNEARIKPLLINI